MGVPSGSLAVSQPLAALGSHRILNLNCSPKGALKILRIDLRIQSRNPLDPVREARKAKSILSELQIMLEWAGGRAAQPGLEPSC